MQNRRALLFLVLAIALGLAATLTARRWLDSQTTTVQRIATVPVVVARADLSVGKSLTELQVETIDWPQAHMPTGAKTAPGQVRDRVLRRAIAAGEPILESALLPKGAAAGLPSIIEAKKRAVSVKVDPVVGVAGFVTPGTRVDVLVTLRRLGDERPLPESKVVLQNIPVLAIDQRLEEVKGREPELVSVVTLEVEPKQAEKLIFSAHEGKLQLALRNPEDADVTEQPGVGVLDVLGTRKQKRAFGRRCLDNANVAVLRGSAQTNHSFCMRRANTAQRDGDRTS